MRKCFVCLLSACMSLLFCLSGAQGESASMTLAELRAAAPESVAFTINGKVYDVTIDIPQVENVPVGYAEAITFDGTRVWEHYTPQKGTYADTSTCTDILSVSTAPKGASKRASAMMDASYLPWTALQPENNPLDPEAPERKARELMAMLGVDIDLAVASQQATSRPYHSKQVNDGNPETPYAFHMEADTARPFKGYDMGCYETSFYQTIHGIRISEDFFPYRTDTVDYVTERVAAPEIGMTMLSENDFAFHFFCPLRMTEIIENAPRFAPLQTFFDGIQSLIDDGTLKSVFSITLRYQPMLVPLAEGESTADMVRAVRYNVETEERLPFNARLILLPCWKVSGYNTKVGYNYRGFGFDPYKREDVEPLDGFSVRFDALTGNYVQNALYGGAAGNVLRDGVQ